MGAPPLQIDTRQQAGKHNMKNAWFAAHGVHTVGVKLDAGDYAVSTSNVLVDTKNSVDELAMDCGRDHARFVRELDRAAASGCRLVVLVEAGARYNDRAALSTWMGRKCRSCRRCDPNADGRCEVARCKPMSGSRLVKIMDKLERDHGARFEFCGKRDSARRICELLGIGYEK